MASQLNAQISPVDVFFSGCFGIGGEFRNREEQQQKSKYLSKSL